MDDSKTVKERVEGWCESKATELTHVSISGGLTAAVLTQLFAWPQTQDAIPEFSRICWYSGLVLVITAVTLATQQNIALTRARASPRGWAYLRSILSADGEKIDSTDQSPSQIQLYMWQVPVMMLNFSNMLLVLGILVLVLRNESTSTKFSVGAVAVIAGVNYLGSMLALYHNAVYADKSD
ncbi:hypothetical protein BJX68DRAFT_265252 [Aspergillus pseudodeflectus]|uniref:Uncharacterized protein n=1 Tax=Aspergillus pseudodeflectus TaxID=176178 RepID=A0ABR4KL57_9EURO